MKPGKAYLRVHLPHKRRGTIDHDIFSGADRRLKVLFLRMGYVRESWLRALLLESQEITHG